jgi:NADPH:quinone reductase-like Zn-dependent oxidoreductase
VLAASVTGIDQARPLSGLRVGDVPEPAPREGWVTVQVRAASLNHHELWTLRGVGVRPEDLPSVLGTDAAGVTEDGREVVVHAVLGSAGPGEDETLAPDLHLLSERGVPGTLAERVSVPARNLVPKPASLGFAEAACLPTAYLTAYRMLFTRAGVRPGDRVLVQGAGGGVSTAALGRGRAGGLEMYVTSRSQEKRQRALQLGAAAALEPGGRLPVRVDAVIETVGAATWGHSLRALRPGGTVVVSGATSGDPPSELVRLFWRGLTVAGSTMGTLVELEALCRLVDAAGLKPVIDSVHALADARTAFERLESGVAFGKIVVETT